MLVAPLIQVAQSYRAVKIGPFSSAPWAPPLHPLIVMQSLSLSSFPNL